MLKKKGLNGENMKSIWRQQTAIPARGTLRGEIRADAVVVGAGMAGILTAYLLQEAGLSVVVLDAETIASGQTQDTTAKITSQHNLIYSRLIRQLGNDLAGQYAHANQNAIGQFEALISDLQIPCDFQRLPAYLYTNQEDEKDLALETASAKALGIDASYVTECALPFPIRGAVRFENQAQFQPLTFLKALSDKLTIFEKSKVYKIENKKLYTENGRVEAESIVLATHYPFINRPGYYFLRMHQERSYVLALENAQVLDGIYLGTGGGGFSFRNFGQYLLLGGGSHRAGEHPGKSSYTTLEDTANRLWPNCRIAARWSAQDCTSLDGIPYIGHFSDETPHLYVATGFNKWGMTSSMVSAHLLTDQILGRKNPDGAVFSPQRFHIKSSTLPLLKDGMKAVSGLGLKKLIIPEGNFSDIRPGQAKIIEYNGIRAGVYRDDTDKTHIVSTTCPHLGCILSWNSDEKTWDCPCHGSRFDYHGSLLSGPALEGLHRVASPKKEETLH